MCDTSYRHSNCLDQFRKSFSLDTSSTAPPQEEAQGSTAELSPAPTSESTITVVQEEVIVEESPTSCENETPQKILCPLCRGDIKEWVVVEDARRFMNAKSRSCSCETCTYNGTYADLRKHARLEHPLVRPSEADPERERNWRRLERQRDLGDLLSTLQSSMGDDRADESIIPIDDGSLLTVFFLIRVFRPGSSSRSSSWSGTSRTRAQLSIRRRSTRLWGESYEEETASSSREEDNNESSDDGSVPWMRRERVRRRTTPDNQP